MEKSLYANEHLEPILKYSSQVMSKLNRLNSQQLAGDLSAILRNFSLVFRDKKNHFCPLAIEFFDDELTDIKWIKADHNNRAAYRNFSRIN